MRKFLVAASLLVLVGCSEPTFIMAGGSLSGTYALAPDDWGMSDELDVVQIETRPDDPYSVNIWGVGVGDRFYVAAADGEETEWARYIEDDPSVMLRVGEHLYALVGARLHWGEHADELGRVKAAYAEKYGVDAESNFVDTAWVYRLTPHES